MKINVTQYPLETYDYSPKWKRVLAMKPFAYLIAEMWNDEQMHVVGLQVKQPTVDQVEYNHPDHREGVFYLPFVGDVFLYMDGPFADKDPEELPNTSFSLVELNLNSILTQMGEPDYDPENIKVVRGLS
jgi:hypothetical protein